MKPSYKFPVNPTRAQSGRASMIHENWKSYYKVDPKSGCWLWSGPLHPNGYGMKGMYKAHKLFYEMQFGPVPKGLCVCHTCDVPPCVNPDHLWLGTHAENMQDMHAKGRGRRGILKLAPEQILKIRASRKPYPALAAEFGISYGHVRNIKCGECWTSVPTENNAPLNPKSKRREAKDQGLPRYSTGKPCPHGHTAERLTSTAACRECLAARYYRRRSA